MAKKKTVLSVVQELRDLFKEILERLAPNLTPNTHFEDKRYIRNADGSFTDKQLLLIWAKEDLLTKMNFEQAQEACKALGEGWRPASPKEWDSIIDRSKYNPAIISEAEVLKLKTDDWYWTNTSHAGNSDLAWCVDLECGYVHYCTKGYNNYVRPVRVSQ